MLATSSRCSSRNQPRNCSPTCSCSSRDLHEVCDLLRDGLLLLECEGDGRSVVLEACLRRVNTRDQHLRVRVEQVLHDHHRVVSLFDRLPIEMRGELRQRLHVVVHGDRHVLLRRGVLVRDLAVEAVCKATHLAAPLRVLVEERTEPTLGRSAHRSVRGSGRADPSVRRGRSRR